MAVQLLAGWGGVNLRRGVLMPLDKHVKQGVIVRVMVCMGGVHSFSGVANGCQWSIIGCTRHGA